MRASTRLDTNGIQQAYFPVVKRLLHTQEWCGYWYRWESLRCCIAGDIPTEHILLLLPSMACSLALRRIMPCNHKGVFSYRCLTQNADLLPNDAGPCARNKLHHVPLLRTAV